MPPRANFGVKLMRPGFGPAAELPASSPARRRHGGCSSPLVSANVIGGNHRAARASARGTGRTAYTRTLGGPKDPALARYPLSWRLDLPADCDDPRDHTCLAMRSVTLPRLSTHSCRCCSGEHTFHVRSVYAEFGSFGLFCRDATSDNRDATSDNVRFGVTAALSSCADTSC